MSDKFRLVAYQLGHLRLFMPRNTPHTVEELEGRLCRLMGIPGAHVYTLLCEGSPVAAMGVSPVWKGVFEVWSIMSDGIKKYPVSFHRWMQRLLVFAESKLCAHRLHLSVIEDYDVGERWARALGFEKEAVLRNYGPDRKNHVLYSRVSHG